MNPLKSYVSSMAKEKCINKGSVIVLLVSWLFFPGLLWTQKIIFTLHFQKKSYSFTTEEAEASPLNFIRKHLREEEKAPWTLKAIRALKDPIFIKDLATILKVASKRAIPLHIHLEKESKIWPYSAERKVVASEWGLTQSCRCIDDIKAMLLHEAAHYVCPSSGLDYYPDLRHSLRSVLSPALAFHEGWANYWTTRYSKKLQSARRTAFTSLYLVKGKGMRRKICGTELKVHHYLCNSVTVSNLIWDLTCLEPGYEGMEEALKTAWQHKAPTVVDLLAEYVTLFPSERLTVTEFLENRTRRSAQEEEYERILNGTFFSFRERNRLPTVERQK